MFHATVQVTEPGLLEAYAQLLAQAPEVTQTLINRTVNREGDALLEAFRQEPGPVVHPILWASEKQRRAYFATNGFGHGIPYQRATTPNRLVDQWRLIITYIPGQMTEIGLENDSPVRQYVTGADQQPFHELTGWYQEATLIDDAQARLTDLVETDLIRAFYSLEEV